VQQAELRVIDVQVGADRFDQQRHDLPIDEGDDVRDHQDRHHQPGIGRRRRRRHGVLLHEWNSWSHGLRCYRP
jgi:hypothetical protein